MNARSIHARRAPANRAALDLCEGWAGGNEARGMTLFTENFFPARPDRSDDR